MNIQNPVSSLMTSQLFTLKPTDKLMQVKELLDTYSIHHIPVLDDDEKLVGIISKSDLLYFLKATSADNNEAYLNQIRLKNYTVGEAMTKNTITIDASFTIQYALELLSENHFHALLVVEGEQLVGIVTTHDIIYALLKENKT